MSGKCEIKSRRKTILPSALKPTTPHYGIAHFFFSTLHPSFESSCLLISHERDIKKPKLSSIGGVQSVNLHQTFVGETVFLVPVQFELKKKVPWVPLHRKTLIFLLEEALQPVGTNHPFFLYIGNWW